MIEPAQPKIIQTAVAWAWPVWRGVAAGPALVVTVDSARKTLAARHTRGEDFICDLRYSNCWKSNRRQDLKKALSNRGIRP